MTELIKKDVPFVWGEEHENSFQALKLMFSSAPLLQLPKFYKVIVIECDASGVGIGGLFMQEGKPLDFFNEKQKGATIKYSTNDKEFYALVRVLAHWKNYLWHRSL